MKALIAADDDRILGFAMLGAQAGEVMAAVQTAMIADLPYPGYAMPCLPIPPWAEGLGGHLSNVPERPDPGARPAGGVAGLMA